MFHFVCVCVCVQVLGQRVRLWVFKRSGPAMDEVMQERQSVPQVYSAAFVDARWQAMEVAFLAHELWAH